MFTSMRSQSMQCIRFIWDSSYQVSLGRSASLVKHNNSLEGRNKGKSSLGSDLQAVLHLTSRWVNLGHSEERVDPSYVPSGQLHPAA